MGGVGGAVDLVNGEYAAPEDGEKIFACCEEVFKEYKDKTKDKGTQIIFLDKGVPNGVYDGLLYKAIKTRLVEMGIPENEIAFIQDWSNNKDALSEKMNKGEIRVLIGSYEKAGVGINVQQRLSAIQLLDVPYRPGDLTQAIGRGIRQGNMFDEVAINVYVTERTADTKSWQNVQRKAAMIESIENGANTEREMDDSEGLSISAQEIAAMASGDTRLTQQFKLNNEVEALRSLKTAWAEKRNHAANQLRQYETQLAQIEQAVVEMKKDAKSAQDMSGKNFTITLDGKTYTDRTIAGQAVIDKRNSIVGKSENYIEKIGKFAGFDLYIRGDGSLILRGATDHTSRISISPLGTMTALTNTANGIDAEIESAEKAIARMQKAIPTLKEASIAPFEQADELEAKETELSELESDLAANPPKLIQADSRLDAMFGSSINYQSRAQQANADTQYQERDYLDDEGAIQYQSEDNSKANKYSYEWFVSKPDMIVTELNGTVPSNRADIVHQAQQNAASVGKTNENGVPVVYVDDIGKDVLVSKKSLVHGLDRRTSSQAPVLIKIGNILKNSIRVNELNPRGYDVSNTYVLVGAARGSNGFYVVSFVVNRFSNEVAEINVLYSANAKKESAALLPKFTENTATPTDSTISIANLLDHVNNLFPDILPESVLKHYGYEARPEGNIGSDALYQQRSSPLTNREVLELAASGVGFEQLNEAEKNALEIFGKRLDNLAQLQEERVNLGREYMKQQFTKGGSRQEAAKTLNAMKVLDAKIKETENEVIGLENKEVLKKVLAKARTVVETKEKLQGQEALRRYRIKREESAAVRKYRTRVRNDVEKLRKWLVSPSNKDIVKHVPAEIQKSVADFLSSINMMSKTALRCTTRRPRLRARLFRRLFRQRRPHTARSRRRSRNRRSTATRKRFQARYQGL